MCSLLVQKTVIYRHLLAGSASTLSVLLPQCLRLDQVLPLALNNYAFLAEATIKADLAVAWLLSL